MKRPYWNSLLCLYSPPYWIFCVSMGIQNWYGLSWLFLLFYSHTSAACCFMYSESTQGSRACAFKNSNSRNSSNHPTSRNSSNRLLPAHNNNIKEFRYIIHTYIDRIAFICSVIPTRCIHHPIYEPDPIQYHLFKTTLFQIHKSTLRISRFIYFFHCYIL